MSLTCLKISHDLRLLLTGDSLGNIHVYSLFGGPNVSEELLSIVAHESDISAMDICPQSYPDLDEGSERISRYLLASGSRDRLTHLYLLKVRDVPPVRVTYENISIFDDHESTVSGVKILEEVNLSGSKRRFKIISTSTDKTLVVRQSKFDVETTLTNFKETETFEVVRKEAYDERIHAMEVTKDCGFILTAHDKSIQLQHMYPRGGKAPGKASLVWHTKLSESSPFQIKVSKSVLQSLLALKILHEKVFGISDSRCVSLHEMATGTILCRTGFIATASTIRFGVTQSLDYLISTSHPG